MTDREAQLLARAALWCTNVLMDCDDGRHWDTAEELRRVVRDVGFDVSAEEAVVEKLANEGVAADFWDRMRALSV